MTQIMTPSKKAMTEGQIDKAVANYRALLEKHAGDFSVEDVQTVLGQKELANEQLVVFRRRVEVVSNFIVRRVKVDRIRSPQACLDATGRKQYTNRKVVDAMPKGEGEEVEVVFFKLDRWISDDDLEREFELRDLNPVDPYSLASVNENDPAFADEHQNGTHWKDADGCWCSATFDHWHAARELYVGRHGDGWIGNWWFAGLRKSALST